MAKINILDQNTINQIAAGEVIERPASVVKELIENAIDAGSNAITCEIKGGGIDTIRVTDNGCGIEPSEIRKAFTSHATSKIKTAADLIDVMSLGFRGEALASIASVAEVEVLTKLAGEVMGTRYVVNCGEERTLCDAGCPEGTTLIVRNLFASVPARRKFLKSAITEASYVSDLIEKIALSHPEVSIKYINNGKTVIFTKGNNKLDEVIYGIYGRDITSSLIKVGEDENENCSYRKNEESESVSSLAERLIERKLNEKTVPGISISGYIAKPVVTRSNRAMEHYFVNGRYIRNNIVSKAIEEAFAPYMMQHKYPFTVLNITIDPEKVDVNVHPSKQEIRFEQPQDVFNTVYAILTKALRKSLMIPDAAGDKADTKEDAKSRVLSDTAIQKSAEPFESNVNERRKLGGSGPAFTPSSATGKAYKSAPSVDMAIGKPYGQGNDQTDEYPGYVEEASPTFESSYKDGRLPQGRDGNVEKNAWPGENGYAGALINPYVKAGAEVSTVLNAESGLKASNSNNSQIFAEVSNELNSKAPSDTLFDQNSKDITDASNTQLRFTVDSEDSRSINGILPETSEEFRKGLEEGYKIIGQVFATYWIVERAGVMYIIDQHAAHEKIIYERICAKNAEEVFESQMLSPSIIMSFSKPECACIDEHIEDLNAMGFDIEHFSGNEYHLSGIPLMTYGLEPEELLRELVDSFMTGSGTETNVSRSASLKDRLATSACKAAVKGNTKLSYDEARKLIEDLLKLENPFNCPHGRPVIIEMTKQELEKKFKRII